MLEVARSKRLLAFAFVFVAEAPDRFSADLATTPACDSIAMEDRA
jgi:hypothetical protein